MNFALRAAEQKYKVLVVTKGKITDSATSLAQGGIAAALAGTDNFKKHIKDTLIAGCFHNNKKAVSYMIKRGQAAIKRLIELGVKFDKKGGKLLLAQEGGHSERRIAFSSDKTGQTIENALIKKALANKNIKILKNAFVTKLLIKNHACWGAQILKNKKFKNIYSSITALATGGTGQLYSRTVTPKISTGDGIALSYEAGAKLQDLEFIQFHPTSLVSKGNIRFLISEAVRGEGAYLLNSRGERFMKKIHALSELAPRDIVSRAIHNEEKRGRVWLDLTHKGETFIKKRFPQIYKTLASRGIDAAKDLIPISPAAHYLCGGVKTDLRGRTNVKNLYAFGETAATGAHGANRLASNSLLEALVFSETAPRISKKTQTQQNFPTPEFKKSSKHELAKIRKLKNELKKIMWENVGIIRSEKSLQSALHLINSIQEELTGFRGMNAETIELKNMALAAKLIAKSALARKKSLGCHYRQE